MYSFFWCLRAFAALKMMVHFISHFLSLFISLGLGHIYARFHARVEKSFLFILCATLSAIFYSNAFAFYELSFRCFWLPLLCLFWCQTHVHNTHTHVRACIRHQWDGNDGKRISFESYIKFHSLSDTNDINKFHQCYAAAYIRWNYLYSNRTFATIFAFGKCKYLKLSSIKKEEIRGNLCTVLVCSIWLMHIVQLLFVFSCHSHLYRMQSLSIH